MMMVLAGIWSRGRRYLIHQMILPWSRVLFSKMLSECRENEDLVRAASSKDEYFSAESLFMVLILQQQQKMINELIAKYQN